MRSSERARPLLSLGLVVALVGAAVVAPGCVFRQRREMVESREAYQRCVRENPETHEQKCAALEAEAITREERYEDDARRAWGCPAASGPGCDPRDRTPQAP